MSSHPPASSQPNKVKYIYLLLTVALGIILLWPDLNFQTWLSTGDHGRDLDAAEQVLRGKTVYRDYWWVYGPAMPYYYAVFYKIFGIKIQSILLGKFLIKLSAGILCYLAVSTVFNPWTALMATLWFWAFQQDFFFTYSHLGGIWMVMAVIWCLMRYIREPKMPVLWQGLAFSFALSMIKVNFGITALAALMAGAFFVDRNYKVPFSSQKKLFYFCAAALVPAVILFIYWLLLRPLPMYEIRQCLPYSNADQPYNATPWGAALAFIKIGLGEAKKSPTLLIFYILTFMCALQTAILWFTKKLEDRQRQLLTMAVTILAVYTLFNFHEYIKSGVWYRWFWAQPSLIVLVFIIFETAGQSLHKTARALLWGVIALMIGIVGINSWQVVLRFKDPQQQIAGSRGGVYVANPPDWVATVNVTTDYLNKTLKPGETFFALPYDILYYYLTGRPSPTRQTIFFEHINIPPEQEEKIIKEIESAKINTVVVSNRMVSPEAGLGVLGQTYCPIIGKYLFENFTPVARFGNWQQVPGWGWVHGTMILKRKSAL